MLIRTIKVDVEKYLEDLWLYFTGDINASRDVASNIEDLQNLLTEDLIRVKSRLEVLKDIGIIDLEEYNDMKNKVEVECSNLLTNFNKTA